MHILVAQRASDESLERAVTPHLLQNARSLAGTRVHKTRTASHQQRRASYPLAKLAILRVRRGDMTRMLALIGQPLQDRAPRKVIQEGVAVDLFHDH